jgi:hypothetical protein
MVLFPGNPSQISQEADAILFLSLDIRKKSGLPNLSGKKAAPFETTT